MLIIFNKFMPILTLTTDFGSKSFDVAALKGSLMSSCIDLNIIDISHEIEIFDKVGAAYALKNAAANFPANTIHFTNINLKEGNNRIVIIKRGTQYYVCPDNGMANLMFPNEDFKAYVVQGLEKNFSYKETHEKLCEIVKFAENNSDITVFGIETTSYLRVPSVRAAVNEDLIRATVIYIDRYNNAVVNVDKETFYNFIGNKAFIISTRGNRAHKINKHYSEVEPGEIVCIFNEANLLEIAIRNGKATQLLGLEYGRVVLIETA
ncbi:MAG: SAM hydrolase/SAM-dependent halogenase family protein [Chitinophagales bacterium]